MTDRRRTSRYSTATAFVPGIGGPKGLALLVTMLIGILQPPHLSALELRDPVGMTPTELPSELLPGGTPELASWFECGMRLGAIANLDNNQSRQVVTSIARHSTRKDTRFLELLMAVSYTESRMRMDRVSHAGAVGLLQVTPIAEWHITGGPSEKRHTVAGNVRLGSEYLRMCIDLAGGSYIGALVCYNGGPQRLTMLRNGYSIPQETSEYVTRVLYMKHVCTGE